MPDERWNDDIAYVFSIHKIALGIYGVWPLQKKTIFTRARCALSLSLQITILIYMAIEVTKTERDAGTDIENVLYSVSAILGVAKMSIIALNRKRLCTNIRAAIKDWSAARNDEKTWKIMKKHAFRARTLTLVLLYSAMGCFVLYVSAIVMINLKQIFFTDSNSVDANTTEWVFLIPSGELGKFVTGSQYVTILAVQIVQTCMICTSQCIAGSFFFSLTVHLAGQVEVLRKKFKTFANEPYVVPYCRRRFVDLVNRHNELMEYYQNLEDSFHFLVLVQLTTITIMIALLGLRLDWYLSKNNHVEFIKSVLVMNYLLIESLVYTYGGDFLQRESESIFHDLYAASWFTLPLALMKDLHFAMMRSSIPFRLTGGKFFYVNRETMVYIFKTAASYVSVLRIALKD